MTSHQNVTFERRLEQTVYQEFQQDNELSEHVRCIWTMSTADLQTVHRVIPDGGMNLLFEWTTRGFRCRLVGCLTRPLMKQYSLPTNVLAVRFRPGGASELFPWPASHYSDRARRLCKVWEPAQRLASQLHRAKTSDRAVEALSDFLKREFANSEPNQSNLGRQVVRRIMADPLDFSMRELSIEFGRSRQQITRAVKKVVGLGPKRLARTLRLQVLINDVSSRPQNWAMLAAKYGFYDQAHLIREFQELTGTTPTRLIAERQSA